MFQRGGVAGAIRETIRVDPREVARRPSPWVIDGSADRLGLNVGAAGRRASVAPLPSCWSVSWRRCHDRKRTPLQRAGPAWITKPAPREPLPTTDEPEPGSRPFTTKAGEAWRVDDNQRRVPGGLSAPGLLYQVLWFVEALLAFNLSHAPEGQGLSSDLPSSSHSGWMATPRCVSAVAATSTMTASLGIGAVADAAPLAITKIVISSGL